MKNSSPSRNTGLKTRRNLTAENIVLTKWIGLCGSSIIARKREEELLQSFPSCFVETVRGFEDLLSTDIEKELKAGYGTDYFSEVEGGGIYAALWEMAKSLGTGLDVFLKDIPVKQETIEIANYFDVDPYYLLSGGACLFVTDRGYELTRALNERGINAAVIGVITDSKDRVIINNGSRRFLSPRYTDPISLFL